jgi:hypothetical protein
MAFALGRQTARIATIYLARGGLIATEELTWRNIAIALIIPAIEGF